jgi:L-fuculose-phosphate aldolase
VNEQQLRQALLDTVCRLSAEALNRGTAGNASVLFSDGFLITPTGLPCEDSKPEDMVPMRLDGTWSGARAPSSEWRFHRDIYARRPEAGAVIHCHSAFATALACQGRDIPSFHYMIARFGGSTLRCAPYATFGTQELSDHALAALEGRCACLLGNHGMLVFGRDLAHTLDLAVELETLCEQYWRTVQLGPPRLLQEAEMETVLAKFASYGQPRDR